MGYTEIDEMAPVNPSIWTISDGAVSGPLADPPVRHMVLSITPAGVPMAVVAQDARRLGPAIYAIRRRP